MTKAGEVSDLRHIGEGVAGAAGRAVRRSGLLRDPEPPDQAQLERWRQSAISASTTARMLAKAGVPKRYTSMEIREELIPRGALGFLETWREGGTLLLAGPPGTGKTVTVAFLLGRIYQSGAVEAEQMPTGEYAPRWNAPRILFVKVRQLYAAVFDRRRGPLEDCLRVDLLALDDWGAAYEHNWPLAELDGLVDDRWDRELPTIVTTNLPGAREQGAAFSFEATAERAFSRLCGRPGPGLVLLDRKDLRR